MKRFLISTAIIIAILFVSYFAYTKVDLYIRYRPLKNAYTLRNEIIANISNPFPQADTLVLETRWMFCGNSRPDELPIVFDTQLDDSCYTKKLSANIHLFVLTMTEYHKVMDTVLKYRFKGEYPPSLWDTCRIGKVSADIKAEQLSYKKVRLYENYLYNDTAKYICKDFVYNGDKWSFKIIDTSTQILTK
jgi:hypothetical protein